MRSFSKKSLNIIPSRPVLNTKQNALFYRIINHTKCFDRRDNSILLSNRDIAKVLKVSASSIDQVFRVLSKEGLLKKVKVTRTVIDKQGKVKDAVPLRVVSPRFIWISYTKLDRSVYVALFDLECLDKLDMWWKACKDEQILIDTETGEIREFNWYYAESIANRYTCFDRCYRKVDSLVSVKENNNSNQHHELSESNLDGLTLQDKIWFDKINEDSSYHYSTATVQSKVKGPLFKSMFTVPI